METTIAAGPRDQRGIVVLRAVMIALTTGAFIWLARNVLLEASIFFALAAAYGFLLFRVVPRSVRASTVMECGLLLIYYTLISVELELGVPASGPWFLGLIAGGIAGGYFWTGARAGTAVSRKRERSGEAGDGFTGGWHLALINALSALVLVGIGIAQIVLLSAMATAVVVFAVAGLGGWALFRFPPPAQVRHGIVLALPLVYFALMFVGGAVGQMAIPHAFAYGVLAGILIGGRYWSGPRFGEPRPPFNGPSRRRRRKRRPKAKQT